MLKPPATHRWSRNSGSIRDRRQIFTEFTCVAAYYAFNIPSWSGKASWGTDSYAPAKTNRQPAQRLIKFSNPRITTSNMRIASCCLPVKLPSIRSLSCLLWILSRAKQKQREGAPKKYEMRFLRAINAWLDLHKNIFPSPVADAERMEHNFVLFEFHAWWLNNGTGGRNLIKKHAEKVHAFGTFGSRIEEECEEALIKVKATRVEGNLRDTFHE